MFQIEYSKMALKQLKQLKQLPRKLSERIQRKLSIIARDPYDDHPMVKRLQGTEGYRLRIGDWRAIYILKDDKLILLVVKVASRGSVYQ